MIPEPQRTYVLELLKALGPRAGAIMTRSVYQYPFLSFDFAGTAVKKGNRKDSRNAYSRRCSKQKAVPRCLNPLFAPSGITVLYLPPRNASKIDLEEFDARIHSSIRA